ncbi:MAG: 30S ribosomal protein S19 [Candidatus Pacearchaeota archaeon]
MAKKNWKEKEIVKMVKEITYKGKTIEELKKMDIREFAKYVDARTRRSILRQYDVIEKFLKKCKELKEKRKPIRTHVREMVIVPEMIGLTIHVHNGKNFVPVNIELEMIGHRLGEFSITRTKVQHGAPGIGATRSSAAASVK